MYSIIYGACKCSIAFEQCRAVLCFLYYVSLTEILKPVLTASQYGALCYWSCLKLSLCVSGATLTLINVTLIMHKDCYLCHQWSVYYKWLGVFRCGTYTSPTLHLLSFKSHKIWGGNTLISTMLHLHKIWHNIMPSIFMGSFLMW